MKSQELDQALSVMQEKGLKQADFSLEMILVHLLNQPISDEALKRFIDQIKATHYHELVGQIGLYKHEQRKS